MPWNDRLRRSWRLVAAAFGASVLVLAVNAGLDSWQSEQLQRAVLALRDPAHAQQADELLHQQLLQRHSVRLAVLALMALLGLAVLATRRVVRVTQADLVDSSRRFQDMLDTLPQLVWMADAQGRSQYLNRRWTEYSGLPVSALLGDGWFQAVHADDVTQAMQAWRAAVASDVASTAQFRLQGRDGGHRWFSASFSASRDARGRPLYWLGCAVDIEDGRQARLELDLHRRQLETLVAQRTQELTATLAARTEAEHQMRLLNDQLNQANQQMAQARDHALAANQAKSAFLANMSHEIRTPLNAIVGFTHVLRAELHEPSQRQQLAQISTAAQHLLQVINDLLDLSRIEAGKLLLEPLDFSVPDMVSGACSLVAQAAGAKGLALRVHADGLPQRLHGDATRLTQALLNLLGNAVKYTEQGSITLRVSVAEQRDDAVALLFEVADTGCGIAAAEFARLFNPFAQAERNSTRMHGGSGLGLAITRHIAQQMGGDAGGESQLGQGSTFWFTARLALAQQPTTAQPAAPDAAEPAAPLGAELLGLRVLLAEDNPVNQEVARQILCGAGAQVAVAGDGQQALEMLRQQAYDVVLMDVQMPRLDGLRATRLLRQDPALRHVPVIALTANALPQDRQACVDAGMNDYLAKPVDPPLLYATLQRWRPKPAGTPPRAADPLPSSVPSQPAGQSADHKLAGLAALVDVQQALQYCGGQTGVLVNTARSFARHHRGSGAELAALLGVGDTPAAARLLHSLRGASAALGAVALADPIQRLESAVAQGQAGADLLDQAHALTGQLQALTDSLTRALAD
jgi:PAS domain S-box-containing protein